MLVINDSACEYKNSSEFRPDNSGTKKCIKSNFFRPYSKNQSQNKINLIYLQYSSNRPLTLESVS